MLLLFEDVKSGRDACVFCDVMTMLQSESCGGGVGCLYLLFRGPASYVLPEEPSVYNNLSFELRDFFVAHF